MSHLALQPWQVAEQDFPAQGSPSQQLQFLLNYAVLAPSGYNTQPWRFTLHDETLELWADRTRALPHIDPLDRELIISCGAALFNLRLALKHFGYRGEIAILPDAHQADLLARIQLGDRDQENAEESSLFAAIPQRHTERAPFDDWDIPETVLKWLQICAREEGAWLQVVRGEPARSQLLELVAQADRLQMADPDMRQDLATGMPSGPEPAQNGLPAYGLGLPPRWDFLATALAWLTRWFDVGDRRARHDAHLLQQSSEIVVLGTQGDIPQDWLNAGQALEKVLLRAQSLGIVASFFNAAMEVPTVRSQLQQSLHCEGYPQVLLRLGYGPLGRLIPATPRRSRDQVLH